MGAGIFTGITFLYSFLPNPKPLNHSIGQREAHSPELPALLPQVKGLGLRLYSSLHLQPGFEY